MLLEDADGKFPPISCWSVGGGGGGVLLCVERSYDNYLVGKKGREGEECGVLEYTLKTTSLF